MSQGCRLVARTDVLDTIRTALEAAAAGPALVRAWRGLPAAAWTEQPVIVVAAGKASVAMADAFARERLAPVQGGVVVKAPGVRTPPSLLSHTWRVFEADHPLPSQRNLIAAQAVADAARQASARRWPLVVLLSGGASAHLTLPSRGLSLADLRTVTELMLRAGASIGELNAVRKRCEQLKGGGLARTASPAPVMAFILSDVPGDPIDVIASGPTAEDRGAPEQALESLDRRLGGSKAEAVGRVRAHIAAVQDRSHLANVRNTIIGSNAMALGAACRSLAAKGYAIADTRERVEGEAREQGAKIADRMLELSRGAGRPMAVVWGGETTVTVTGSGFGGRNQEAAIAAAVAIEGHPGLVLGCLATDGIDGTTPPGRPVQAGAIVDGETAGLARLRGVELPEVLRQNDSYRACAELGLALVLGPTGTNVNDLWIGLVGVAGPQGK